MSNNDLCCSKCKSQHHPIDCPLDYPAQCKHSDTGLCGECYTEEFATFKRCEVCKSPQVPELVATKWQLEKEIQSLLSIKEEQEEKIRSLEYMLENQLYNGNSIGFVYQKMVPYRS